jgi:cardiolipin synthase
MDGPEAVAAVALDPGAAGVWAMVWAAAFLLCLFFAVEVLRSTRAEQSIAAWLLLFLLTPPLGVVLYLALGRRKIRKRLARMQRPTFAHVVAARSAPVNAFDTLVRSYHLPPATPGNRVAFHGTGRAAHAALVDLIEGARHSLWVCSYIFGADAIGRDIVARLARRAAAGVQVRLLIDDIGSREAPDRVLFAPLREAGGRAERFMPFSLLPRSQRYSNLRNHRKLAVADHGRVWSGGMNLSEHYLGDPGVRGYFHDLAFEIAGPAAAVYAGIFASDWLFATGERLNPGEGIAEPAAAADDAGTVQVVPSGPDVPGDANYDLYLALVHRAERRLWVASPYFVPDVGLMRAFALAARRGVDVRFLTNRKSDAALIDFASIPYLRILAAAGGRIYRFTDGMIHAKALVMDDEIAFVGTANLDQRSLFLNFEAMALFHDRAHAAEVARWIAGYFDRSSATLPAPTPVRRTLEGLVRLFSPVL